MSTETQTTEFQIDDPEQLSQTQRIKELLNRRTGVIDMRTEAKQAHIAGELDQLQAVRLYQTSIEAMIMDMWTKFENSELEESKELLHEKEIATVTVYPPNDILPSNSGDFAAGAERPDPKEVTINGLEWFINNDPVVEQPFTAYTWNPPGEQTVIGREILGFDVLDKPVQRCIEFLDEVGIDANLDDDGEPIIRNFDQSGDEPSGELGKAEYNGDPDI